MIAQQQAILRGINFLYGTSQVDEALAEFDRVLEQVPNHKDALYNKGVALYIQAKYMEAIALQEQVIAIDSKYLWSYVIKGNAYNEQGMFTQAFATFDECIHKAPSWDVSRNAQGNGYFMQEKYREAVNMYDKSIQLTLRECTSNGIPSNQCWKHCGTCLTILNKGLSLFCMHQYDHALFCFQKIRLMIHLLLLHSHPNSSVLTTTLREMSEDYASTMLNDTIIETTDNEDVNNNNNNSIPLTTEQILAYFPSCNTDLVQLVRNNRCLAYDARTAYCIAHVGISMACEAIGLELPKKKSEFMSDLDVASLNNLADKMFNIALSLVEDDRMYRELYFFRGEISRKMYDFKSALQCYEKCITKNTNEFRSMIGTGRVYLSTGRYQFAQTIFKRLIDKSPQNELALYYLNIIRNKPLNVVHQFSDIDIVAQEL